MEAIAQENKKARPLVELCARNIDARKCPFTQKCVEFYLKPGDVVWLRGPSGVGKSTLANAVAGLSPGARALRRLGLEIDVRWDESVAANERCGAMFQQTTLIDALSVGGNVCCALESHESSSSSRASVEREAKRLVEAVGLSWARDGRKMPQELSGGMARRASLALQLAQRKRVVVLDEPFTGLDESSARAVAAELRTLRVRHRTAFLLISHQPALAALIVDADGASPAGLRHVELSAPVAQLCPADESTSALLCLDARSTSAHRLSRRFGAKLCDYLCYSLPLVALAFVAAGIAIAMLTADLLQRLDVQPHVDAVLTKEVLPLIDLLLGADASEMKKMMTKMMVKTKAKAMVSGALPNAKRILYAYGLAKLHVLELGPLLSALLLSGRIGGSYSGEVAMMQATSQNKLLRTLGRSDRTWSLAPAALAALIAGPALTAVGTCVAVALGAPIGEAYGLGAGAASSSWFADAARDALMPPLRLSRHAGLGANLVELATWPLAHNLVKSSAYIAIVIAVAELVSRRPLTPRQVPNAITASVVSAGLAIILADWAFSQLLLLRSS